MRLYYIDASNKEDATVSALYMCTYSENLPLHKVHITYNGCCKHVYVHTVCAHVVMNVLYINMW